MTLEKQTSCYEIQGFHWLDLNDLNSLELLSTQEERTLQGNLNISLNRKFF